MTEKSPLKLTHVSRQFGSLQVLDDLTLEIGGGEFVVLVGPSGCGKTTLINVLSGNEKPTTGTVETHGIVRTVHQSDGLFPWLTVAENIDMGLREVGDEHKKKAQRDELLTLIHLKEFANHYPHQLSGGMRQRVELARALVGNSDILLMDEPFSALDYQTRLRMRRELVKLLDERPRTVVFVTHDIEEAAQLADRVLVLSERPARIQCELRLDLPRPRPRPLTHPQVVEATRQILQELGLDVTDDFD